MKRLCVIVPGYNNPPWRWRRCLNSLIKCLGSEDEVICVDDGSTDGSAEIIDREFASRNGSCAVRVIHQKNAGLASARNAALANADARFVTFVDSDDEIVDGTFRQCLAALEKTNCDVALYGVRVVWPDDGLQKIDTFESVENLGKLTPTNVLDLYKRCLLNYSCNKVYSKEFLDKNNLRFNPEGMPSEDIIFNLQVIMTGATFCTVPFAGYIYYRTRGTLLSRYKKTSFKGQHLAGESWKWYKARTPGAQEILGELGEISPSDEIRAEWRNIWMPGTPYSFFQRWQWLKKNPGLGGFGTFCKMTFFMFLRRYFYLRPVRRWNDRRIYPHATEWKQER